MIGSTASAAPAVALRLGDIVTAAREPRVYDLTLSRALGFERARNIRRLIKNNRPELETHGTLVDVPDQGGHLLRGGANEPDAVGEKGRAGRPGRAFFLNEGQALVICALTRTPVAARVRGELIRVFMAHRAKGWASCVGIDGAALQRLAPAERRLLRDLLRLADVVWAPRFFARDDEAEPVADAPDDAVPYLLAPLTAAAVDSLAAFEAELADREPDPDAEPDDGAEPDNDGEPSLGSVDADGDQTNWAMGAGDEREADDSDREPDGDELDGPDDNGLADTDGALEQLGEFGLLGIGRPDRRGDAAIEGDRDAVREAATRLRTLVLRLRGTDPLPPRGSRRRLPLPLDVGTLRRVG